MDPVTKKIAGAVFALAIIGLSFILISCASDAYQPKTDELANSDVETLEKLWLKSTDNRNKRSEIVKEFEKRNSVRALIFCLSWATSDQVPNTGWNGKKRTSPSKYSLKECIDIVNALGRLGDSTTIQSLRKTIPMAP
ncbi:MAG: hypothetical protein KAS40_20985, partial [Desulfobacterales bacterium]|nr:hypothetical protein [Desulfobacterales bacterium]